MPAKWVQRAGLRKRLNEGLEINRQITLVSAPAGFGKTTCVSDWANSLDAWPVAWLSLDPADDDPGRFFNYFIAALQFADAKIGQEIEGVIRSGQLPPSESLSTALINDITAFEGRFLVVLDDFHFIQDQYILHFFEQLIANFPSPLHLVLITREDPPLPLARLRANNQLTEIRARDLRFTRQDMDRFLNEGMGLSLSEADIAALEDKTEGWIAGLQMVSIAMQSTLPAREPGDPTRFIAALSGSHRFILGYLTEQVLDQQPEAIRHFLLETSILEKLNGGLCEAVTRRADSHDLLEQLCSANLFLTPLDDERHWYRYHHLFAGLLQDLQKSFHKDKTAELHRRASRWYHQEGMVNEAIQHALAARDYAMAVDLLESHAMEMIKQGYAKTVNGWVQALPKEWGSQSPRTNLAFAWSLLLRGDYAQASGYIERLRATLSDSAVGEEGSSIRAEWLVLQSLVLYMRGELTDCEQMAADALGLAPEEDRGARSLAYYVLGSVAWFQEDFQRAVENFQISIQLSRAAENLIAEMMSTTSLANMALERGQLHLAFEITSQAAGRIERLGVLHPISAVIYASLGDAYYQWFKIEEARHHFQHALHLSSLGGSNTTTILCHVLLSRLSEMEGDLETANREVQKAVDLMPAEAPEYVRQWVVSQQVHVYLALNRPAAAESALQGGGLGSPAGMQLSLDSLPVGYTSSEPSQEKISSSVGMFYNSLLRLLLYRARSESDPSQLKPGIEFADRTILGALKSQQLLVALETLLLRAQMHAALGDQPSSAADYVRALELAEPEGFIGVFVEQGKPVADALADLANQHQLGAIPLEYVERILNACPESRWHQSPQPVPGTPAEDEPMELLEPLTDRELDVLRLMAEGLKYKEIAEKLFISLNTVRYHVKAIYGKLNVSNRIQAIKITRRHRIL